MKPTSEVKIENKLQKKNKLQKENQSPAELEQVIAELETRFEELSKSERRRLNRFRRKKEQYEARVRQEQEEDRTDVRYMKEALKQAKKAAELGEVPIGCVIVKDGKIIARGYNRRNTDHSTLSHAEVAAIRKASRKLQDWRLEECTLYVTLEPCQMCAGAIVQARMKRVVMGCMNPKAGCGGSVLNILQMKEFNHQVDVKQGVLEEECSAVLSDFFEKMRNKR